jgi:hypothetical protein
LCEAWFQIPKWKIISTKQLIIIIAYEFEESLLTGKKGMWLPSPRCVSSSSSILSIFKGITSEWSQSLNSTNRGYPLYKNSKFEHSATKTLKSQYKPKKQSNKKNTKRNKILKCLGFSNSHHGLNLVEEIETL